MADRHGGSTPVLEHKKGLLIAVSFSVDRIISHFSTSRNLVQKAQLGDSRLTPEVGHLLLNTLCPALYALVADGLKPFQSDVIVGSRRTSPWSVVEASVKPGLSTRCLHYLYSRICNLSQLSSSKKKFNAFLFGLLNIKQLELWISHLQKQSGLLSVLYTPDAFLALREATFQHLFEELLLLLQPLSVLSFHLDLLFEHHHLHVDVGHLSCTLGTLPCQVQFPVLTDGLSRNRSQSQQEETGFQAATKDQSGEAGSGREDSAVDNDETGGAAQDVSDNSGLGCEEQPKKPQQLPSPVVQFFPKHPRSSSLQQTFRQVLQWGDKLTYGVAGYVEHPDGPAENSNRLKCSKTVTQQNRELAHASGPTSWWEQLSRASRIYTSSNKENVLLSRRMKLRGARDPRAVATTNKHSKEMLGERGAGETESRELEAGEGIPETQGESPDLLLQSQREEKDSRQERDIHQLAGDTGASGYTDLSTNSFSNRTQKSLDEGSHESDVQKLPEEGNHESDTQKSCNEEVHGTEPQTLYSEGSHGTDEIHRRGRSPGEADSPNGGKGLWLGRLFGAHLSPTKGLPTDSETNAMKSRRPSRWLAPSFNILDLVKKGIPPQKTPESPSPEDGLKPQRLVRALCDHVGSAQSHLSFRKGDILQVVSTVDEDWICCDNRSSRGLVPVGYTSLIL